MKIASAAVVLLALLTVVDASALDLKAMKDTPLSKLDKQDMAMMIASVNKALNESADGEAVNWSNAKKGTSGSVTPLKTFAGAGGQKCRRIAVASRAQGRDSVSESTLCQDKKGAWVTQK